MRHLAWVLLLLALPAVAKDKHAPLPEKLLSAKTIYIDNQSGYAAIGDNAYDEMSKWGRFKILSDKKTADLVLLLSATAYDAGSSGTGTVFENGTVVTHAQPVTGHTTHLTFIDPETGAAIWADSRDWGKFKSATRGMISDLRKRFD